MILGGLFAFTVIVRAGHRHPRAARVILRAARVIPRAAFVILRAARVIPRAAFVILRVVAGSITHVMLDSATPGSALRAE